MNTKKEKITEPPKIVVDCDPVDYKYLKKVIGELGPNFHPSWLKLFKQNKSLDYYNGLYRGLEVASIMVGKKVDIKQIVRELEKMDIAVMTILYRKHKEDEQLKKILIGKVKPKGIPKPK